MLNENRELIKSIEELSHKMRLNIIELAYRAGKNGAHLGGSLSVVEILATLYKAFIKYDPENFEKRDRLILSKGHAALALFCALEGIGMLTKKEILTFKENGSYYIAHAKRDIRKGLEFSGGSLGLGISFAVGVALACQQKENKSQIFVVIGDGECNEGVVWEALMFAKHYNLKNLTIVLDYNHLQVDGFLKDVMNTGSLNDKFSAFGFNTIYADGHCVKSLLNAFEIRDETCSNVIIAETIKGKGISYMENKFNWHYGVLSEKSYKKAISELENNE